MSLELLAFIASAFGVGGSLPQIFKILRTRETRALSLATYTMIACSSALWVAYGLAAAVYSIVFWNSLSALLCLWIVGLKIENEREAYRARIAAWFHQSAGRGLIHK